MNHGNYRPESCDLCGSESAAVLARVATGRSLRSDRVILRRDLLKLRCRRCGLVREGHAQSGSELIEYYTHEYTVAPADYSFYTSRGPVRRSALLREWLSTAFGEH